MKDNEIWLSLGVMVPPVEELSEDELWNLILRPDRYDLPEDARMYIEAAENEFYARGLAFKPVGRINSAPLF